MGDLLLTNLNLLDPVEGVVKPDRHVRVSGTTIDAVSAEPLPTDGATVVDIGGRTLMPGLIDCHVHANAVRVRYGLAAAQHLPASLIAALASRILQRMLMRGFTAVRDAGGADRGLKEAVELGLFRGPRLFVAGRALSQTGGHGDFRPRVYHPEPCACAHLWEGIARIADGVPQVRHAARDEIRLGADHIKVMASGGVASAADPIHFQQYASEELEAIVDEAARADTYVMAHAYTAEAVRRAVDAGIRTIEHGNLIDEATAGRMAEAGTFLVPTLATYHALARSGRELGFPEESLAKLNEVLEVGTRSLELAKAAGVKIAYGTDLLGELHDHQLEEFELRAGVLSPLEQIRGATTVAAEVLRMEGRLGVIAPGALADMLVVDGNPLEDLSVLHRGQGEGLTAIIRDGAFVKNTLA